MARESVLVASAGSCLADPGRCPRETLQAAAPGRRRAANRRAVEEHDHSLCNLASWFPTSRNLDSGLKPRLGAQGRRARSVPRPPRCLAAHRGWPHQLGTSLPSETLRRQGVITPNPTVNQPLGGSVLQKVADNRRTWPLGAGGRWFESSRPDHFPRFRGDTGVTGGHRRLSLSEREIQPPIIRPLPPAAPPANHLPSGPCYDPSMAPTDVIDTADSLTRLVSVVLPPAAIEEDVKIRIVMPFLRAFGYGDDDFGYEGRTGKGYVDIAASTLPVGIAVEAKAPKSGSPIMSNNSNPTSSKSIAVIERQSLPSRTVKCFTCTASPRSCGAVTYISIDWSASDARNSRMQHY